MVVGNHEALARQVEDSPGVDDEPGHVVNTTLTPSARPGTVAFVCCLFLAAFGLGPRFALLLWWIFGDRVGAAFDSWVWPLLGLLLLPWTTLCYLLMWTAVGGVSGLEWLFVGFGVLLDVASYSSKYVKAQYDSRYPTAA